MKGLLDTLLLVTKPRHKMDNNKLRNTLHKRPWYYHSSEESGHGIKQVNEYCKEGSQKKVEKLPLEKYSQMTRHHL